MRAMLLTGALPLFIRGPGDAGPAASPSPLWRPAAKVAAPHLAPWLHARQAGRLGEAAAFIDARPAISMEPEARRAALDLALSLADREAAAGEPAAALSWLEAAETLVDVLPETYVKRRRDWTGAAAATPDGIPAENH
jgi:hypothetical protein